MFECRSECRSCGSPALSRFLSLGEMPLTAAFLQESQLEDAEPKFPLNVVLCGNCSLVQIRETLSPEAIFCRDYPYYSSFSDTLLEHSRRHAFGLIESRALGAESLVVELASNDGYLLRNFVERRVPVLGIDPAEGPALAAERDGVPTMQAFFGAVLAMRLASEGKSADVIIANNVLAHVPDLNGFVEGIGLLLKPHGVAVIEVPYVRDLVDSCEFDTIYHEHICYFSVTALDKLFARHELHLNRVEHFPLHGGTLRLQVGHLPEGDGSVQSYLESESAAGLTEFAYFRGFADRAYRVRDDLLHLLKDLNSAGKSVAAYGAAAKGCVLLNFAGVGADLVSFVVDRNPHKQGMYMPGVKIPVRAPEALLAEMPDYAVLLAWNFRDEIIGQQAEYRRRGGKFIIPIPSLEIV
jgi:SAM-dependent methyltransferase